MVVGGGGGCPAKMRKILDPVLQKLIHRLASLNSYRSCKTGNSKYSSVRGIMAS